MVAADSPTPEFPRVEPESRPAVDSNDSRPAPADVDMLIDLLLRPGGPETPLDLLADTGRGELSRNTTLPETALLAASSCLEGFGSAVLLIPRFVVDMGTERLVRDGGFFPSPPCGDVFVP